MLGCARFPPYSFSVHGRSCSVLGRNFFVRGRDFVVQGRNLSELDGVRVELDGIRKELDGIWTELDGIGRYLDGIRTGPIPSKAQKFRPTSEFRPTNSVHRPWTEFLRPRTELGVPIPSLDGGRTELDFRARKIPSIGRDFSVLDGGRTESGFPTPSRTE